MSNPTLFSHTVDLGHGYSWVYTSDNETPLTKQEILEQNSNNYVVKVVIDLDKEAPNGND